MIWLWLACSTPTPDVEGAPHTEEEGQVHLSQAAVEAARLTVAPVEEKALAGELVLQGRIGLDPRKEAIVSAWIAGQVDTITVRAGEAVTRGQQLARVQSPELGEAVAAFRTATARDQAADARLERLRRLEADGVSSRAQVLEAEADHAEAEGALEAAEERLSILGVPLKVGDPHAGEHFPSRVPVKSPIAGTVLTTDASVGERVQPGQALFHVGDLDEIWLVLDVFERDLGRVREGQAVRFGVEAWPERTFEGRIEQVGDWIEPEARTVEVRVVVENADHALKPNMYASARLTVEGEARRGLVVPLGAVQDRDGARVVFVDRGQGRFEARPVVEGERIGDQVLVQSGLVAGEPIVTGGAFTLLAELEKGELGHGHAH